VILVDTDVLIAHLRGVEAARQWLLDSRKEGPLRVSTVTVAELTGGMRSAERRAVLALLAALRAEPMSELIARRAGSFMRRYRRSHSGIGLGDYLIAGTADVLGLELKTPNVRRFPMFEELEPPFRL
jgi:predicted nucleic acid-binding protein